MHDLASAYRDDLGGGLTTYERRVFSQNGEDGVVAEILRRIGTRTRWFVEFGAGTGNEGCCVALADIFGWSGLFIEADDGMFPKLETKYRPNDRVVTTHAAVTTGNVESLFAAAGVPADLDVLSIDIDGNDYWIWQAIVSYRPALVVIEYNANLPHDSRLVRRLDESVGWDETAWFSASLLALEELAESKGYKLVHTDLSGVNAFFVRNDLAARVGIDTVERHAANYRLNGGRFELPEGADRWVEVPPPG